MKRLLKVLFVLGALGAFAWVVARYRSRRWSRPCPFALRWLLENPVFDHLAGSATLLERLGVAPGMRVLDAGCGPGRLTLPLAERVGPAGKVVALDIQPQMLEALAVRVRERGLTNVEIVQGGLGQGLLEQDTFDRALLVTVLGEVPDRELALREIYGALKPGGVLSVTEVLLDPDYQSRGTVRRLAEQAGFSVGRVYGNAVAFTMNLVRPSSAALSPWQN